MIAFIHANLFYDFDHARHFLAWAFNVANWATNGSEQIIAVVVAAAVSYMIWPRLHDKVDAWLKGHLHSHRKEMETMLADHHKAIKATLSKHMTAVKAEISKEKQ